MNSEYTANYDHRSLKAQRAIRCAVGKLQRLGYVEHEAMDLVRDAFATNKSTKFHGGKRSQSGREIRLKRAQDAIRQLIRIGFNESEIAAAVGVSSSAIAHILFPHDGRSASEELTLALEALVPKVKVLETCNASGERLDLSVRKELEGMVSIALVSGIDSVRFPRGISAFLAAIGNPLRPIYVMLIEKPLSEYVAHLKLLEHEIEHILDRIRELRIRAESKEGRQSELPPEGTIA